MCVIGVAVAVGIRIQRFRSRRQYNLMDNAFEMEARDDVRRRIINDFSSDESEDEVFNSIHLENPNGQMQVVPPPSQSTSLSFTNEGMRQSASASSFGSADTTIQAGSSPIAQSSRVNLQLPGGPPVRRPESPQTPFAASSDPLSSTPVPSAASSDPVSSNPAPAAASSDQVSSNPAPAAVLSDPASSIPSASLDSQPVPGSSPISLANRIRSAAKQLRRRKREAKNPTRTQPKRGAKKAVNYKD